MNTKRKIIVFDSETTGFDEHDEIIQIGSVMLSNGRVYTSEEFVHTDKEISIGSMTAHGIRKLPKKKLQKLHKTTTIKRINKLEENDIVVGHNIDFDLGKAKNAISNQKFKVVDTLLIAQYIKRKNFLFDDCDKLNLQYLRYKFITEEREEELVKKHKPIGGAHSALFDSLITNEIAEILLNTLWEMGYKPWEKAIEIYENRFNPDVVVMPFGKYKGLTILEIFEINYKYLEWFYENVDDADKEKKSIMILSNQLKNKKGITNA